MFVNIYLHCVYYLLEFYIKYRILMKLRRFIDKRKITQYGIADMLGISPAYLSLILNGKRRMTSRIETAINQLIDGVPWDIDIHEHPLGAGFAHKDKKGETL